MVWSRQKGAENTQAVILLFNLHIDRKHLIWEARKYINKGLIFQWWAPIEMFAHCRWTCLLIWWGQCWWLHLNYFPISSWLQVWPQYGVMSRDERSLIAIDWPDDQPRPAAQHTPGTHHPSPAVEPRLLLGRSYYSTLANIYVKGEWF